MNGKLASLFIRHPRAKYGLEQLDVTEHVRHFVILNRRQHRLHCTLFGHVDMWPTHINDFHLDDIQHNDIQQGATCLIYCHGSAGSRLDGVHDVYQLCRFYGMSLLVFDFEGAGRSEGKYISLGVRESSDVAQLVDFCERVGYEKVALWGRSMGAVASLLYSGMQPSQRLSCLILDSPYCELREVAEHVVSRYDSKLLSGLANSALPRLRKQILQKVPELDIMEVNIASKVHDADHPAFFFHAEEDDFVPPEQSLLVYEAYGSEFDYEDKLHRIVEGSHNTTRGPDLYDVASRWIGQHVFGIEEVDAATFVPRTLCQGEWEQADLFVCKPFIGTCEEKESFPEIENEEGSEEEEKKMDDLEGEMEIIENMQSPRSEFKGQIISPNFELLLILPGKGLYVFEPYTGNQIRQIDFMQFEGFSSLPENNLAFFTLRNTEGKNVYWCKRAGELSNEFDRLMKDFVDQKLEEVGPDQVLRNLPKAIEQLVDNSLKRTGKVSAYDIHKNMCATIEDMIGDYRSKEEISRLVKESIIEVTIEKTGKKPKFRKPLIKKRKKKRRNGKKNKGKCIIS